MKSIFVTGTGTGVGKTLVSAALLSRWADALDLVYVKPVQTGCPPDDDAENVLRLTGRADRVSTVGVRLRDPVSPHLAAAREGVRLGAVELADAARDAAHPGRALIEGAGGVLVPLNERETIADLILALDAVVVVVAEAGLGTINHTLLTLAELERRAIEVAGVVLCGETFGDNPEVIADMGGVEVIGSIALPGDRPAREVVAEAASALDPSGALERSCS